MGLLITASFFGGPHESTRKSCFWNNFLIDETDYGRLHIRRIRMMSA
jgi:hypothetical protein